MTGCPSTQLLEAYYDGELPAGRAAEMAAHVESCVECARELRVLRDTSQLFVSAPRPTLSADVLARLHAELDSLYERSLFRFAELLSGVAAAVLIAATLWGVWIPSSSISDASIETAAPNYASWEASAAALNGDSALPAAAHARAMHTETASWIVMGLSPGDESRD